MTPRGHIIGQRIAADLEDLREHDREHPQEADAIRCAILAHLRSWRPEVITLASLDLTERIGDTRKV